MTHHGGRRTQSERDALTVEIGYALCSAAFAALVLLAAVAGPAYVFAPLTGARGVLTGVGAVVGAVVFALRVVSVLTRFGRAQRERTSRERTSREWTSHGRTSHGQPEHGQAFRGRSEPGGTERGAAERGRDDRRAEDRGDTQGAGLPAEGRRGGAGGSADQPGQTGRTNPDS
ncbi:DUF6332 family protein [Streptomyces sp. SHP 1-2]|uniref:DUF6332 family protein n=1 Tax=Streptomyces sp. SHP 1-2 TaxID=2769489 RepID=UPI002237120D|nr:DUF6332 family protein [Streptomyces sp. SHP 1-2]